MPKSRSWLRVSLRAIFVAVTVACIGLAWYAYLANKEYQVALHEKAIRAAKNGDAIRDYQIFGSRVSADDISLWAKPFAIPQIKLAEAMAEQPEEVPKDFAVAASQARYVTMHGAGFNDRILRDSLSGRTEALQLFGTSVSADGLQAVKRCRQLQTLTCWSDALAPAAIDSLKNLPKLVSCTFKTNLGELMTVSADASSGSLQEIVLHLTPDDSSESVNKTEEAFAWLGRMPRLQHLSVYGKGRELDDPILRGVCHHCAQAKHLTVVKGSFSAEALALIAELDHLQQLDLWDCGLSAKELASLPIPENLKGISFLMNPLVGADAVRALKTTPSLQKVKISGAGGVIQTIDVSSSEAP
jgi:hypothetical protein